MPRKQAYYINLEKILVSTFSLKNGTLITPLLLFYLDFGLLCTKKYRFVEYIPQKCFNIIVQFAVDARRQSGKNRNSSVVAKTTNLLANSSFGYQIMNKSRNTVTKSFSDEKTHATINNKKFKRLSFMKEQLCEVKLTKSEIEHKEPNFVGFFILHCARLGMLELYCNIFDKYCNVTTYEELEMDTDPLYLALGELYDCIRRKMKEH